MVDFSGSSMVIMSTPGAQIHSARNRLAAPVPNPLAAGPTITVATAGPPAVPGEVHAPPVGAPFVPPVPNSEELQQPGQLGYIREIWHNFRAPNAMMKHPFPEPVQPPPPPPCIVPGPQPSDPPSPPSP
jgi:hypothetical protein